MMLGSELRLHRDAQASGVIVIRHALSAFMDAVAIDEETRDDILIAVGEAIANAVEHAYEGASAPGEIEVHARIADPRTLEIDVADRGRFIERERREGRGFGMRILRSVARAVAIETDNGTRVHMLFDIMQAA
jgi:anti-sigma regulatory factor (Ser/Thr protein kinase)